MNKMLLLVLLVLLVGCTAQPPVAKCVKSFENPDAYSFSYAERDGIVFVYCLTSDGQYELLGRAQRG